MIAHTGFLSPADAARQLGVSAKALRLYEERGLIAPGRTAAGWRAYGPAEMARATEIVALRELGFSLEQVARVLGGDGRGLEPALAAHQATLEARLRQLAGTVERVRGLRDGLAAGATPSVSELAGLQASRRVVAAFDLPWPWGGERFELHELRAITFIVGPLFSGKTKLAQKLGEVLPGGVFVGLDRAAADGTRPARDAALQARVEVALGWLVEDGATRSDALLALVTWLEVEGPEALVFDLVEQGLDEGTQLALMAHLRRRGPEARPLFLMTRSSAILDLASARPDEAIILCPANHSPPLFVAPYPGAPGYEAVATCLGSPEVRARSEGVIAVWQPPAA